MTEHEVPVMVELDDDPSFFQESFLDLNGLTENCSFSRTQGYLYTTYLLKCEYNMILSSIKTMYIYIYIYIYIYTRNV